MIKNLEEMVTERKLPLSDDKTRCYGEQAGNVCKIRDNCARHTAPKNSRIYIAPKLCDSRFLAHIRND